MQQPDYAAVFDRAAATYDRVGVEMFGPIARRLVDVAELRAGEHVLDVGTGRGAVLGPAAAVVGPGGRAVGVDLSTAMIDLTAAELAHVPQVEVRLADAAELPADLGTFDAVLSSLVLFFTSDPAAALRSWAARLRPGGRLGLATFLSDPDDALTREVFSRWIPAPEASPDAGPTEPAPTPFELVRDPAWLDAALADAGLDVAAPVTERLAVRFTDVRQWERWALSQGMRAAVEAVPDHHRAEFLADVGQVLDANRLPDGTLGLHLSLRYTVAHPRA